MWINRSLNSGFLFLVFCFLFDGFWYSICFCTYFIADFIGPYGKTSQAQNTLLVISEKVVSDNPVEDGRGWETVPFVSWDQKLGARYGAFVADSCIVMDTREHCTLFSLI